MEKLIPRLFKTPKQSFFLFGPRGTGKSTLLKQFYPDALWIDLLEPDIFRSYSSRPERLKEIVLAYSIEKVIEQYFKRTKEKMNAQNVLEKLGQIKLIESQINGIKIFKSVELTQEIKKILFQLEIPKIPTFLTPK